MTTCLIWLHRNCFLDDNTLKPSLNIHRIFDKIEWHVIPAPVSTDSIVSLGKDGCHTSQVIFVTLSASNSRTEHPQFSIMSGWHKQKEIKCAKLLCTSDARVRKGPYHSGRAVISLVQQRRIREIAKKNPSCDFHLPSYNLCMINR